MTTAAKVPLQCAVCGKTVQVTPTKAGKPRPPQGWKHHAAQYHCPECWSKAYRLCAVTFPISGPLSCDPELPGPELRKHMWADLKDAWSRCRYLANWAMTQLFATDVVRKPGDDKSPPPRPKLSLYDLWNRTHHARAQWTGSSQSANCLLHACERKYAKVRREVIWWGSMSLPCHRYPIPYPVHNQSWSAHYHEIHGTDGHVTKVPAVSVAFGGRRWALQLRGGATRGRQLKAFGQIVSGRAITGELALYRQRASEGAHRSTGSAKPAGGGNDVATRLMCKMVAWLPREKPLPAAPGDLELKTLSVRTSRRCLLVATHPTRKPWLLHDDSMRTIMATHYCRIQAIANDTKSERRTPKRFRGHLQDRLDVLTWRYRQAMKARIERAAAMLVNWAERVGAEVIDYDDTADYCRGRQVVPDWLHGLSEAEQVEGMIDLRFPKAQLRDAITAKAELRGIAVFHTNAASEEAVEPEVAAESDAT